MIITSRVRSSLYSHKIVLNIILLADVSSQFSQLGPVLDDVFQFIFRRSLNILLITNLLSTMATLWNQSLIGF